MKDILLYTRKLKLEFDSNGVSIFNLQELINEIEKDYKLIDVHPSVATFEGFQYLTVRVVRKSDQDKKPLGFSMNA